jgi:surfeit locus 1 family protein
LSDRLHSRPRWIAALAAAAGIAATLALGNWQLNRAHEKEALGAQLATLAKDAPVALPAAEVRAQDLEWRRVTARGTFEPRYGILIDNRIHHGVAGYHVVVNRGWIAGNPDRSKLPEVRTPEAPVDVAGLATTPTRRFLELGSGTTEGRVWQNLTLERYGKAFPIALQPVVIQQESPLDDGLVREWDPPNLGVDKHYGYAFQWFAMAATILVITIVLYARRRAQEKKH